MSEHWRKQYGTIAKAFHWITVILVLVAYIYGPGGSETQIYSTARDFDRQLHETIGMLVFALVAMRALWWMIDEKPVHLEIPRWMEMAAMTVRGAFYLLLFAIPLTAIIGAWLAGHAVTLLAGVEIPPPVGIAHTAGETIATIHTWLGDTILWLAGFHALASLYHHYVLRDGVLVSMLPRWLPLRQANWD